MVSANEKEIRLIKAIRNHISANDVREATQLLRRLKELAGDPEGPAADRIPTGSLTSKQARRKPTPAIEEQKQSEENEFPINLL